ncbi:putative vesicle-associated membrane protein-associated protein C16G5.05c [Amylocarpus encephaloides]|uniref:Vesicle-associated membrane protein-associated protein C16G5.05c n=1 Tax=Amylocarpus encephaloides TaxID=45428 RepID=A0A9P8C1Q8_9HELO|nr:putative vesicle-associated membrane protein-associated protein C16G5.05c [Amylocarpus encephaloides]
MSVEIDPQELGFHRPFTQEVSQTLKIRNTNHTPVAFKVKTTAPKQYCVRPNSGRVEPGNEVEVTVLLQAMKQEPPLEAKCRDKFLVQSVAITADKEFTSAGSIWQHVDDAEKSSVQEKKIRVVYLGAEGSGGASTPMRNGVNGASHGLNTPQTQPPAYSGARSPSPEETFTPDTNRRSTATAASGPYPKEEDEPSNNRSLGHAQALSQNPATTSTTSSTVAASVPASYEELKSQLADAKATIASHGKEAGLRMRKVAAGEASNKTVNDIAQRVQASHECVDGGDGCTMDANGGSW